MKKTLASLIAIALIPFHAFAQGSISSEEKRTAVDEIRLEEILNSARGNICEQLSVKREELLKRADEIRDLQDKLLNLKESTNAHEASEFVRKSGLVLVGVGVAIVGTTAIVTKVKYGKAFLDMSGLFVALRGAHVGVIDAQAAILGGIGELLTDDEEKMISEELERAKRSVLELAENIEKCEI